MKSPCPGLLARLLTPLRRPAVLDAGLALLLGALSLLTIWASLFPDQGVAGKIGVYESPQALRWYAAGALAVMLAELAVLPLRRRFPVPVLLITLLMAIAHAQLLPVSPAPADVAVAVAVYGVAAALPVRRSAALTAVCVAAGAAALTLVSPVYLAGFAAPKAALFWPVKPASLVVPVLVLGAAWIAGDSARTRRAYLAGVEQRAHDAEQDRDRRSELAAAGERERITRELHDVVAHALSVMVVQAQGGSSALRRRRTGQAGEALDAIVATGRGALAETRRVLGVIRMPTVTAGPGDARLDGAGLAPQPCLDDLPELAERVRNAGTPVELVLTGQVRPLPRGIELSAYRIVQEALTNTIRHAGPGAAASVCVVFGARELTLGITDDGHPERTRGSPGSAGAHAGHGLTGMRQRAAVLGGTLSAGPAAGGGFRVDACLPVLAPGDTTGAAGAGQAPSGPLAERGGA